MNFPVNIIEIGYSSWISSSMTERDIVISILLLY